MEEKDKILSIDLYSANNNIQSIIFHFQLDEFKCSARYTKDSLLQVFYEGTKIFETILVKRKIDLDEDGAKELFGYIKEKFKEKIIKSTNRHIEHEQFLIKTQKKEKGKVKL